MITRAALCAVCAGGLAAVAATPALAAFPGENGKIAFASSAPDGPPDIWTMSPNGRNRTNLTRSPDSVDTDPKWSADGRRIAFMSNRVTPRNPDGDYKVFVMHADGSHVNQITFGSGTDITPTWSPDGRTIAFARYVEGTDFDLWTVNADGSGARSLVSIPGFDAQPDWSADGRRIVFASERDPRTPFLNIHILNLNTGNVRQFTFSQFDEERPNWSPDGRQVAFHSDFPDGIFGVFTIRSDGGVPTRLTTGESGHPVWSPNGRKIVFGMNGEGTSSGEIWTMRTDGSRQRQRTMLPDTRESDPDWQALPWHQRAEEDDDD